MTSPPPPSYYSYHLVPLVNRQISSQPVQLTSEAGSLRRGSAPPTYSPRHEEEAVPGPAKYPGNRKLLLATSLYIILLFFARFAIFFTWIYENRQEKSPAVALVSAYFLSNFNIWLFGMVYLYKDYMTMSRFKLVYFLRTPYPYLFILDNLMFMEVPLIGLKFDLNVYLPLHAGVVLTVLNTLAYYIVSHCELADHEPLTDDDKYFLDFERTQTQPDSPFRILESTAFKITLLVISPVKHQTFTLVRKTSKPNEPGSRGPKNITDRCFLRFNVDAEIQDGTTIKLIPGTHELPGAIKIKDYRSFGFNKREKVKTRIYGTYGFWKRVLYAELKQKYRLRS